jgi:threonine dehydrogenase-like Zn-dependent dehydrogenase
VLVLGGGPIGLSVIQSLKARGPCTVIVSEVSSRRKEYAKQFGADYVIDPTKEDVVARCRELGDQIGVHVAFDAAGVQAGLDAAVNAVRMRGTVVNIAVWEKPCQITPNDLVFKERRYMGVATYVNGDFQEVIDAISSGRMKPQAMITKKIKLDQVVEQGFQTLINDKDNQVKILVEAV